MLDSYQVGDVQLLTNESPRSRILKRRWTDKVRLSRCWYRRGVVYTLATIVLLFLLYIVYFRLEDGDYDSYKVPIGEQTEKLENIVTFQQLIQENFEFDIKGYDVMVFLHMQKTGGTSFGKHLVRDLDLERGCECHRERKNGKRKKMRCDCFRPGQGEGNWLFSRYSTGWKCGLHPDWTELTGCVDLYLKGLESDNHPRRYFYITILREPLSRYLSEFKHVQRGATWKTATNMCGGKSWANLLPKCYQGEDWSDVTLDQFIDCEHNLASNRQTRMLADLELVDCYNKSMVDSRQRDRILLQSAKANLDKMAYFGITEDQRTSQYMFEETFNLEFRTVLSQYNVTHSSDTLEGLSPRLRARVRELNSLDTQLYSFAKQLMQSRFNQLKAVDSSYAEHMARLARIHRQQDPGSPSTLEEEY